MPVHRRIGDDETYVGEQLARMPFDLGDYTARLVPALRLIREVRVEPLHLGLGGAPNRPGQQVRDLFLEHCVGGQPDGVKIAVFFRRV